MISGDYGVTDRRGTQYVIDYQTSLKTLGYYDGVVDGIIDSSDKAVRSYQTIRHLNPDGDVGPATLSQITKDLEAKQAIRIGVGASGVGGAVDAGDHAINAPTTPPAGEAPGAIVPHSIEWTTLSHLLTTALIIAAIVGCLYLVWRFRGRIFQKRTPVA